MSRVETNVVSNTEQEVGINDEKITICLMRSKSECEPEVHTVAQLS